LDTSLTEVAVIVLKLYGGGKVPDGAVYVVEAPLAVLVGETELHAST